jgi:hypothetical protein
LLGDGSRGHDAEKHMAMELQLATLCRAGAVVACHMQRLVLLV